MDADNLQLKKWDPRKHLKDGDAVLLIGKRKTGKTTAAIAIAHELARRGVEMAVAYSGTMDSQTTFDRLLPPSFCYKGWNPEKVMEQMHTIGRINGQRKRAGKKPLECTMYMDDLGYDKKFAHSSAFREIMMNGRHHGIRPIVTMQYSMTLEPDIRGNFDWILVFHDILPSSRTRIKTHFAELLGDSFDSVFDACTENYKCLVIHNSGNSNRLEDIFYWYKAPLVHPDHSDAGRWRIGGKEMWKWDRKHYDAGRAAHSSLHVKNTPSGKRVASKPKLMK